MHIYGERVVENHRTIIYIKSVGGGFWGIKIVQGGRIVLSLYFEWICMEVAVNVLHFWGKGENLINATEYIQKS